MRRRRINSWVGLLAVAVIGLAPATIGTVAHAGTAHPAPSAKHFPANPINIFQANGGGFSVYSTNLNAGTPVLEGGIDQNPRNLTWTDTCDFNGYPCGTIQFSNGNYMAADTGCFSATIKSDSSSDGTIWAINNESNGQAIIYNRYCAQTLNNNAWSLAGDSRDQLLDQWRIGLPGDGSYRQLDINAGG